MYYKCESCLEAYFLTEEARSRHYAICIAVQSFSSARTEKAPSSLSTQPTASVSTQPTAADVTTHPLDLSVRKRGSSSRSSSQKKTTVKPCVAETSRTLLPTPAVNKRSGAETSRSPTPDPEPLAGCSPRLQWELKKGLKSARDYIIRNSGIYFSNKIFLDAAKPIVNEVLRDELQVAESLRYNLLLESTYVHPDGGRTLLNFKSRSRLLHGGDAEDGLNFAIKKDLSKLLEEEATQQQRGSGWSLEAPATLSVRVSRFTYKTPTGSKYIVLPKKLKNRRATVNVHNNNNECFKYAVLTKHIPQVTYSTILNEHSFSDYEHIYNFTGLDFPLKTTQIKRFERLNPHTTVNVFVCGPECVITPWRVVTEEKADHIDLLLYTNKTGESHYIYITNFAKLILPQLSKDNHSITVCKRCFNYLQTRRCRPNAESWLKEHLDLCVRHKPTLIRLPEVGKNVLKFTQFESEIPVPIIVCADFESTLLSTVSTNNSYQQHIPNSFCTLIKSNLPDQLLHEVGLTTLPHVHRSENAGQNFLLHMRDIAQRVEILYSRETQLSTMTAEEISYHERAEVCDLCKQSFNTTNVIKNLDHCHITGKYRYTLCGSCNLRARIPNFIPVYLHNLTNYDQAFIVQNLGVLKGCEVKAIPANNEKFISISVKIGRIWIRFLDSYRLLSASLAELAGNLRDIDLIESSKLVPADSIDLIRRKGVYCYDYVKGQQVFEETCLPPKEAFFNRLNDEPVDPEDYNHAKEVWSRLGMKTFGDFHDFYLRLDVCLLMDILTAFRKTCLTTYKLDCCHHYTAPGLAFRAMLRISGVVLELLTDSEQFLMVESAMRGGLVQCNLRYAKANNKTLEDPEDYDAGKETSYLFYLDCTNLYGHAMTMPLPTGNFKWINPEGLDWFTLPIDSPHGYIMECDIEYPNTMHEFLQDLPPLPEQAVPPGGKMKKLIATLTEKKKYVAHYRVFQQAVKLGLKVTKVHRVLSFSQSLWMKNFVLLNADLRRQATSKHDKNLYKLLVNACYGKFLEGVRSRVDVRICTSDETYQKLIKSPRYEEHTIISENVVTVRMRRKSVLMNKPIYLGMVVLDLSKTWMYEFYYDVLLTHFFHNELELVYIDTDAYLIKVTSERDVYAILKEHTLSRHLDRSVYPNNHPLWSDENKGRLGTFKDETKGRSMQEFVGLRPKMYAYRFNSKDNDESITKAKGIKTAYVKKNIRFKLYKDILFGDVSAEELPKAQYNLIRTKKFQLYSISVSKKGLSSEYDKRHLLDCGIRTLPFGHYALRNIVSEGHQSDDSD